MPAWVGCLLSATSTRTRCYLWIATMYVSDAMRYMIILTSNRMLADLSILSALFCAWQWIVLLWSALFAFSFKMDLAVDKRLSGDGSIVYRTPAVKTFPEPSIHVICGTVCVLPDFDRTSKNIEMSKRKRRKEKFKCDQEWVIIEKRQQNLCVHARTHRHTWQKYTQAWEHIWWLRNWNVKRLNQRKENTNRDNVFIENIRQDWRIWYGRIKSIARWWNECFLLSTKCTQNEERIEKGNEKTCKMRYRPIYLSAAITHSKLLKDERWKDNWFLRTNYNIIAEPTSV